MWLNLHSPSSPIFSPHPKRFGPRRWCSSCLWNILVVLFHLYISTKYILSWTQGLTFCVHTSLSAQAPRSPRSTSAPRVLSTKVTILSPHVPSHCQFLGNFRNSVISPFFQTPLCMFKIVHCALVGVSDFSRMFSCHLLYDTEETSCNFAWMMLIFLK